MKRLLVDGGIYTSQPPQREDDLAREVEEHVKELFGKEAVYFNLKKRIATKAGIASIPDGYVIDLAEAPRLYVVEVELASHSFYDHVIPQLNKFINALKNPQARQEVVEALYDAIVTEPDTHSLLKLKAPGGEVYKLLNDLLSHNPTVVIPIDQATSEAREACEHLPTMCTFLEITTFVSDAYNPVSHAHLYESLQPAAPHLKRRQATPGRLPRPAQFPSAAEGWTGKRVSAYRFDGKRSQVFTFKDILMGICRDLCENRPADFQKLLTAGQFRGRKRVLFSVDPKHMTEPKQIGSSRIYVETNLSANNIKSLCYKLLQFFGYPDDILQVELGERD